MDIYLSDDGQCVLALCSALALPGDVAAFTLSEWNKLERQIENSPLKRPANLQGLAADELVKSLNVSAEDAQRIARLLDRSGRLALELEGLFSRGIWAVTRAEPRGPAWLLTVARPGLCWRAWWPGRPAAVTLPLAVPAGAVYLFDAATGARIESAPVRL